MPITTPTTIHRATLQPAMPILNSLMNHPVLRRPVASPTPPFPCSTTTTTTTSVTTPLCRFTCHHVRPIQRTPFTPRTPHHLRLLRGVYTSNNPSWHRAVTAARRMLRTCTRRYHRQVSTCIAHRPPTTATATAPTPHSCHPRPPLRQCPIIHYQRRRHHCGNSSFPYKGHSPVSL